MSVAPSVPELFEPDGSDPDLGMPPGLGVLSDQVQTRQVSRVWNAEGRVDEHQFMWLLVRSLPDLRNYARRLTGKVAEASDLVQEACRRAIESRVRFTAGSDMRAWLCCILRNYHRDRLRRLSREMLVADHEGHFATPSPEPLATWALVSDEDLHQGLASLQPQYRSAYVLYAMEGRSYGEVARTLGVPSSTVGTRILRARQLLRAFLLERLEQRAPSEAGPACAETPAPAPDRR